MLLATKVHSTTPGSPDMARRHDSAKRAAAQAMLSVALPAPACRHTSQRGNPGCNVPHTTICHNEVVYTQGWMRPQADCQAAQHARHSRPHSCRLQQQLQLGSHCEKMEPTAAATAACNHEASPVSRHRHAQAPCRHVPTVRQPYLPTFALTTSVPASWMRAMSACARGKSRLTGGLA